jgi:hypothetical protein
MTQELIDQIFDTVIEHRVDVIYVTSNDKVFFTEVEAKKLAETLEDKTVTPWTYSVEKKIREISKETPLEAFVAMVDLLKFLRLKKMPPIAYKQYVGWAAENKYPIADESAYVFGSKNVTMETDRRKPAKIEKIFLQSGRIVEAELIKSYPNTRLFFYDDMLIMTCPTHFELVRGDVYRLFGMLLGKKPQIKKDEIAKQNQSM